MDKQPYAQLPNGAKMPLLGLGTWQSNDETMEKAIECALDCGYRHIDTAFGYGNEPAIGRVLKRFFDSGKYRREDIFITSKLYLGHMGKENVRRAALMSLDRLQLDYLDLYLIHGPFGMKFIDDKKLFPRDENDEPMMETYDLVETWKILEDLVDEGKLKAIGVSNFNSKQIERIRAAGRHPVSNLQVECHAYFPQDKLFNFCKERGIVFSAFAPLGSPTRPKKSGLSPGASIPLDDETVKEIAQKYNKTAAQVLIRNLLQRGISPLPKSSNPDRIKQNFDVFDFELSEDDMKKIAALDTGVRLFNFSHLAIKHPEYPFHEPF